MWNNLSVVIKRRARQKEGYTHRGSDREPRGFDLADARPLQLGDSPRAISRTHLAKFGELVVVEKHPDRRAVVLFLVDISDSEGLGTVRAKRAASLDAVRGLGVACLARGHAARLIAFTDRLEHESPLVASQQQWDDEVHTLVELENRGKLTDPLVAFRHAEELFRVQRPVDMVCIVSDFLFPQEYRRQLSDLSEDADTIAVVVSDPMENEVPPLAGTFILRDVETGETVYASAIEQEDPSAYLDELGIDRCTLSTRDDEFRQFAQLQDFFHERAEERTEGGVR